MPEVLLLRHGKSDWSVETDDYHRPLKNRGKRAAQRMGCWLREQELIPTRVISSPAERAYVTAEKTVKAMGLPARVIRQEERLYLADVRTLLDIVAETCEKSGLTLVVGHNPAMEQALRALVATPLPVAADGKLMPTATLAHLELPSQSTGYAKASSQGHARLLHLIRPADLPEGFPFPGAGGIEYRDRPAYYYQQSGVIPYRLNHSALEVLVITSSSGRAWGVPKGIVEPGYTPQDSAAREALEEAGVEGVVGQGCLGSFTQRKWGGECQVAMYPMRVTGELSEPDWQNKGRQRRWVTLTSAAELVTHPDLSDLIAGLPRQLQEAH